MTAVLYFEHSPAIKDRRPTSRPALGDIQPNQHESMRMRWSLWPCLSLADRCAVHVRAARKSAEEREQARFMARLDRVATRPSTPNGGR